MHNYGENRFKSYSLEQDLRVHSWGKHEHGRSHGARGRTGGSAEEESGSVEQGEAPHVSGGSSALASMLRQGLGRRSSSTVVARAGRREGNGRRKNKASPAPLFIGEAC